jgi:SAM-dependent methyltransferase
VRDGLGEYSIPRDWGGERERLRLLEGWLDPSTRRHLEVLGIGPGWRCLEVGAGSGSVARWLAGRVEPNGHVVAADIDTRFLEDLTGDAVHVRQCDVRVADFPEASFDLIHTRWVLEHLSDRVGVMQRMVEWLRPGGWVCFEEPDCYAGVVSRNRSWARHVEAYRADPGYDVCCGRALPEEMRSVGLVDLRLDIEVGVVAGGGDLARWHAMTVHALRPALVRTGAVTGEELDEVCAALEQPHFLEPGFTVVAVTARRPE